MLLPNLKTGKHKDRKNTTMNSCHSSNSSLAQFSESSFFNGNVAEADNTIDETFSNDEDEEELMLASEKAKWILFKDLIEAMELHFQNLGMKNMALFYGMKI